LVVVEGALNGELDDERLSLRTGDVIIIPAGVKHRFTNASKVPAVTFNLYVPAQYPARTKG